MPLDAPLVQMLAARAEAEYEQSSFEEALAPFKMGVT